jgi:hypothetical protein
VLKAHQGMPLEDKMKNNVGKILTVGKILFALFVVGLFILSLSHNVKAEDDDHEDRESTSERTRESSQEKESLHETESERESENTEKWDMSDDFDRQKPVVQTVETIVYEEVPIEPIIDNLTWNDSWNDSMNYTWNFTGNHSNLTVPGIDLSSINLHKNYDDFAKRKGEASASEILANLDANNQNNNRGNERSLWKDILKFLGI